MLNRIAGAASVAALILGTAVSANADACSGHNHVAGTVVGGVTGGVVGGVVTHSPVGVIGGAVLGGLAGNAIAREGDCYHGRGYYHEGRYYRYRRWQRDHYRYYS
ncbi:MAG TPA: hypothetical protein VGG10_09555 [Rhizomicrobium sp.]|jgi:hypothetical protein